MTRFPAGWCLEALSASQDRTRFISGTPAVDDWLRTKARQHQQKHLSVTRVLLDQTGVVAGYYTLASGHIDFGDLPPTEARGLPQRTLPAVTLAWLGVRQDLHGKGLGSRLLAAALADAHRASATLPFIGVVLDAVDESSRGFYEHFDFEALPGHRFKMFLSFARLEAMVSRSSTE